jgi:hypothetical protein
VATGRFEAPGWAYEYTTFVVGKGRCGLGMEGTRASKRFAFLKTGRLGIVECDGKGPPAAPARSETRRRVLKTIYEPVVPFLDHNCAKIPAGNVTRRGRF